MSLFRRILLVSDGLSLEREAFKQALSLARANEAELAAVIVGPELSARAGAFRAVLIEQLKTRTRNEIDAALAGLPNHRANLDIAIDVDLGPAPDTRIVRRVLRDDYDLVVKQAADTPTQKGYRAIDMGLLRKCPAPVWLSKTTARSGVDMRVGAAIDADALEAAGRDLGIRILQHARGIADAGDGVLQVVSAWDFPYETYLRNHPFIRVSAQDLREEVEATRADNHAKLQEILAAAQLDGTAIVRHVRGAADAVIPDFVAQEGIDVLVMGTLVRTGIPGFVIGNTAENILQDLSCSLLALKPADFRSPVHAY